MVCEFSNIEMKCLHFCYVLQIKFCCVFCKKKLECDLYCPRA